MADSFDAQAMEIAPRGGGPDGTSFRVRIAAALRAASAHGEARGLERAGALAEAVRLALGDLAALNEWTPDYAVRHAKITLRDGLAIFKSYDAARPRRGCTAGRRQRGGEAMSTPKAFLLGSEKEPAPEHNRQVGLQRLLEKNSNCEHVVIVGEPGPAALAVKMRGADLCPHCTRREAAYWRMRAKTAEGMATAAVPRPTPPEGE